MPGQVMNASLCTTVVLSMALISSTASAGDPVHRALLIGINEYESPDLGDLRGALNDIELIRHVLTTRLGFATENVQTMADAEATRTGILRALEELVSRAGPEDQVYVHYSGHGSQVKDLNGDETDGMDETLVPHDGRMAGIADVTDDELGTIFSRFRTKNVLIILDSCHSGTATRGTGIRTRSVPRDTRIGLYAHDGIGGRAVTTLESAGYVLMTGAASNQSALDGPIDGKYYGFFSYCLGTSLGEVPLGTSAGDVFSRIELVLARLQEQFGGISMPEPQLEASGARIRGPLFATTSREDSDARREARFAYLIARAEAGQAVLVSGATCGASPGTRWAIFPPGESEFRPGSAIATALVTGARKADAIAAISPAGAKVPDGARAVATMASPPGGRIPVLLGAMPPSTAQALRKLITARLPAVDFVTPDVLARFIVDCEQEQCRVYGLAGLHLVDSFAAKSPQVIADRVIPLFARSSPATLLATLHNPSSRLLLDVREVLPAASAARGFQAVASKAATAYRFRVEGEPRGADNSLMLELRASADCYITIVDVDQTGGVNQLFPNEHQNPSFYSDGLVPGNRSVRIPDSFDSGNEAGFFWDCSPPTGLETIQVFACTDIETARLYRRAIQQLQGRAQTRGVGGDAEDPLRTLREELTGLWVPRGFQVVSDVPEANRINTGDARRAPDWAAVGTTVLVEDR